MKPAASNDPDLYVDVPQSSFNLRPYSECISTFSSTSRPFERNWATYWARVCGLYACVCGLHARVCGLHAHMCGLHASVCGLHERECGFHERECGFNARVRACVVFMRGCAVFMRARAVFMGACAVFMRFFIAIHFDRPSSCLNVIQRSIQQVPWGGGHQMRLLHRHSLCY